MNMLHHEVYKSIDELSSDLWLKATPHDFYFQYEFLEIVEKSGVENAAYRYVVIFENQKPIGSAVISRFLLHLDLLSGDKTIIFLKKLFPKLFQIPMICCGIPVSYGQNHFYCSSKELTGEAIQIIHDYMISFADETNTKLLIWKEFDEHFPSHVLTNNQYINLPTLPDTIIQIPNGGIKTYSEQLRSPYRRKFKPLINLFSDGAGPVWEDLDYRFEESPFQKIHVEAFHQGYSLLMERTLVKLETYPEFFFSLLADSKEIEIKRIILTNKKTGEFLEGLVVPKLKTMYFILISKPQEFYKKSHYRQFIVSIVLFASVMEIDKLHLGQTSYYAKMSTGANTKKLSLFLNLRSKWRHQMMRTMGNRLFPEIEVEKLNPLKETP